VHFFVLGVRNDDAKWRMKDQPSHGLALAQSLGEEHMSALSGVACCEALGAGARAATSNSNKFIFSFQFPLE